VANTVLAIGAWQDCGRLIASAISNGWSVLHTLRLEDLSIALQRARLDLILLSGYLSNAGREAAAGRIQDISRDTPMVIFGAGISQDSLLSALVGAGRPIDDSHSEDRWAEDPDAALREIGAGSFSRTVLTPTLCLLEPASSQLSPDVQRAVDFIEANFAEPISLSDAARAAAYSPCHFCRLFKEQLGMSFVSYLSRVRIRHALSLLARSEMSITTIAFEVGFNDLSHFERVFRTIQRQSPSAFRQQAQQSQKGCKDRPSRSPSTMAF
jgi:AraC-like DNA-binding protein